MKSFLVGSLLIGLTFSGCGQKETPPAPKANPPPPTAAPMPSLGSTPAPPPPPGTSVPAVPTAAPAAIPTFEGKDEAERLTMALRAYYDDPNRPAITSFEPLVKARLIPSVPVPPPGKKYVIDLKRGEVRLENK